MATFLELCQAVARDSGTFPNLGDPTSVSGQTGRALRVVSWVNDAWEEIQREQTRWRWMIADATGNAVIGVNTSSGADLGISERFERWEPYGDGEKSEVSTWDADIGQSDEGPLAFVDEWPEFRRLFLMGGAALETGKPRVACVAPNGNLLVYPTPDKAYKLRCPYVKSTQVLSSNSDIPEMPAQYHGAIKWQALVMLGLFDEAETQTAMWQRKYARAMEHLRATQLPQLKFGESLA